MTKSGETRKERQRKRKREGKEGELTHSTVSRSRPGLLSVNSNSRAHRCFRCWVEVILKEDKKSELRGRGACEGSRG